MPSAAAWQAFKLDSLQSKEQMMTPSAAQQKQLLHDLAAYHASFEEASIRELAAAGSDAGGKVVLSALGAAQLMQQKASCAQRVSGLRRKMT